MVASMVFKKRLVRKLSERATGPSVGDNICCGVAWITLEFALDKQELVIASFGEFDFWPR